MGNLSEEVKLIFFLSLFLLLVAIGIITLVMVYQRRQAQMLLQREQQQALFEKELLGAQLAIQEQTLKNIAEEIHDNIGQMLQSALMMISNLQVAATDRIHPNITATRDQLTRAIADLRSLSKSMHTDAVLSAGLKPAIERELQLLAISGRFGTSLTVTGDGADPDPKKELILFRTIQEAITNAIRHSGGSLLTITLNYLPHCLDVTITDNGGGFTPAAHLPQANGLGMHTMESRIVFIGGRLHITPLPTGTTVYISLPTVAE